MNEFVVSINGKKKNIFLSENSSVKIGSKTFHYQLKKIGENTHLLKLGNKFYEITSQTLNDTAYAVVVNGSLFELKIRTALQERAEKVLEQKSSVNSSLEVKAPMPGLILKIDKEIGAEVSLGDPVLILEAMKMENELRAPVSGIIKNIFIKTGQAVEKGLKLFSIEPM